MDAVRLAVAAGVLLVLLVWALVGPASLQAAGALLPGRVSGVPRLLVSTVNVAVSVGLSAAVVALTADMVRRRRPALLSAVVSCALAVPAGLLLALLVGAVSGLDAAVLVGPRDDSAGLPVTAVAALLVGSDARRWRAWRVGYGLLAGAVVCALSLGSLSLTSAAWSAAVAVTASMGVRVALGVLPARPTDALVRAAPVRSGLPVTALRPGVEQAGAGRTSLAAELAADAHGPDSVLVTVVDPDVAGSRSVNACPACCACAPTPSDDRPCPCGARSRGRSRRLPSREPPGSPPRRSSRCCPPAARSSSSSDHCTALPSPPLPDQPPIRRCARRS